MGTITIKPKNKEVENKEVKKKEVEEEKKKAISFNKNYLYKSNVAELVMIQGWLGVQQSKSSWGSDDAHAYAEVSDFIDSLIRTKLFGGTNV